MTPRTARSQSSVAHMPVGRNLGSLKFSGCGLLQPVCGCGNKTILHLGLTGMSKKEQLTPSLNNPFAQKSELEFTVPGQIDYDPGLYEAALQAGYDLQQRPMKAAGIKGVQKQHEKKRMTIWERIQVLADDGSEPKVLYQNWG